MLKCTSAYPASPENSNVLTIPDLRKKFNCEVGLSDHTVGIGAALAAISHGATIVEKHFTLDRNDGGVDSSFSIEPNELKLLVDESKKTWQALGTIKYGVTESEKIGLQFRRSIYVIKDIDKDEQLTNKNIRIIRPGKGLLPKHFDKILGKKVNQKISRGTPMSWEFFRQKMTRVCILDYGSGNIGSLKNIINHLNFDCVVSNKTDEIQKSTHLILPGVGAFGKVMEKINKNLPIKFLEQEILKKKKLFLGICIGMQVLAEIGEEFGINKGLGWIPGKVEKMRSKNYLI